MSDLSDYHRLYDSRIYYPLLYRTIVSYREVIYNPAPDLTLMLKQRDTSAPEIAYKTDIQSPTIRRYHLVYESRLLVVVRSYICAIFIKTVGKSQYSLSTAGNDMARRYRPFPTLRRESIINKVEIVSSHRCLTSGRLQ